MRQDANIQILEQVWANHREAWTLQEDQPPPSPPVRGQALGVKAEMIQSLTDWRHRGHERLATPVLSLHGHCCQAHELVGFVLF